jgi:hypothetical protein
MSLNRRIVRSVAGLLFLMGASASPCLAQTWQWNSLTHPAYGPPLRARSTVALTERAVSFSYTAQAPSATAPGGNRLVVIASCRAALSDLARASAMRTAGRVFFLLELKPSRLADCDSGKKAIAALPGSNFAQVSRIASAVNRACCSPAAAAASARRARIAALPSAAPPRPSPRPAKPTPRPAAPTAQPGEASPAPQPPAARPKPARKVAAKRNGSMSVVDWVESEGLFVFIRVHNTGGHAIALGDGEVLNCKNVDVGCGPFAQTPVLGAHKTVTVATVASTDQRRAPSFTYVYTAMSGGRDVTRQGTSKKIRPAKLPRISAEESRAAESSALGALRAPAASRAPGASPNPVPASVPARLVARGASRLALGERGVAVVRVLVSANGTPEEATIVSITNRKLTAAAIETAVSSTYSAAMKFGRPVTSTYMATFRFSGEDPTSASVPVWRRSPLPSPSPSAIPVPAPTATPASKQ